MAHNHRVNPTGRTVVGLADSASPAPAQPADYVEGPEARQLALGG